MPETVIIQRATSNGTTKTGDENVPTVTSKSGAENKWQFRIKHILQFMYWFAIFLFFTKDHLLNVIFSFDWAWLSDGYNIVGVFGDGQFHQGHPGRGSFLEFVGFMIGLVSWPSFFLLLDLIHAYLFHTKTLIIKFILGIP